MRAALLHEALMRIDDSLIAEAGLARPRPLGSAGKYAVRSGKHVPGEHTPHRRAALPVSLAVLLALAVVICSAVIAKRAENARLPGQEGYGAVSPGDSARASSSDAPSGYEGTVFPDFLYGYTDHGMYDVPVSIVYYDTDRAAVTSDGRLSLPDSSVLSVIVRTPVGAPRLMERDESGLVTLFGRLRDLSVKTETDMNGAWRNSEEDSELSAVMRSCEEKELFLVTLTGFADDSVYIRVERENAEPLLLSCSSEPLHRLLRELCGTGHGDLQCISDAVSVSYLDKNGEWVILPEDRMDRFRALAGNVERIKNNSTGCPFDLQAVIKTSYGEYSAAVATDSCGVIVIEDETYQLVRRKREEVRRIFPDALWDGGGWDGSFYGT